jgi:putative membrane protein
MRFSKAHISVVLLVVFYTVGVVGLSLPEYRELFLKLTPFNLLLTLVLLSWGNNDLSKKYGWAFLLIALIGYGVEVIGVHTKVLFGDYTYGSSLGRKVLDVPLVIGVNWFILAFASRGIAVRYIKNPAAQIIGAAAMMVLIDFFIEPVAVVLDFWQWYPGDVPLRNYFMWFITSLVVQIVFFKTVSRVNHIVAWGVYIIQTAFFVIMNVVLV